MIKDLYKSFYHDFTQKYGEYLTLFLIIFLGLGLRLYKLGEDSFWYDEVGQVLAAIQPRFVDMLLIIRQHAGAMPLDYLVSRVMASINLNEEVMRFPSVVWGTLSIPAYYALLCQFEMPNKKQIALLVAFMISISPVNIQYSQEMRFYAALMFFYALSTLFLIKAIETRSIKNWLYYVLISFLGMYFHPFILLVTITGLFFILRKIPLHGNYNDFFVNNKDTLVSFLVSVIFLVAVFTPGYLFFHARESYSYDLGLNNSSFLYGLGLKATLLTEGLTPFGLWHYMQIVGTASGMSLVVIKLKKYSSILFLWFAVILQISIIVFLDLSNGYLFLPRQIIHFTPMTMLLTSVGFMELLTLLKPPLTKKAFIILMIGALGYSSIPYINAIYDHSKGSAREIAQKITDEYQSGQKILILTSQYETVLEYYLFRLKKSDKSEPITLAAENIEELEYLFRETPNIFFIAAAKDATGETRRKIGKLGFEPFETPKGTDFLYIFSP